MTRNNTLGKLLAMLLVKEVMMWQSSVPGGRFGRSSLACPVDWMRCLLGMLTNVGAPVLLKLEVGALPWR